MKRHTIFQMNKVERSNQHDKHYNTSVWSGFYSKRSSQAFGNKKSGTFATPRGSNELLGPRSMTSIYSFCFWSKIYTSWHSVVPSTCWHDTAWYMPLIKKISECWHIMTRNNYFLRHQYILIASYIFFIKLSNFIDVIICYIQKKDGFKLCHQYGDSTVPTSCWYGGHGLWLWAFKSS